MHRLLLLAVVVCSVSAETLIFSEDFNEFDLSKWGHEITLGGGGNWEFEYYSNNRTNSFVRDGILYIKPTLTADTIGEANVIGNSYTLDVWGSTPADMCTGNAFYGCSRTSQGGGNYLNPIQSARIRTVDSFAFKYGRIEVVAKLPLGDWLWPAIWMLPKYNSYGNWPASGEIDIMESRGNSNGYPEGVNTISSTLHWGPYWNANRYTLTHGAYTLATGDFSEKFHTFGLVWTEKQLKFYVDSESTVVLNVAINSSFWDLGGFPAGTNNPWEGRPNNAPFDQQFYLVLNVACGGTNGYFPDGVGGKPWSDTDPHSVNSFYNAKGAWYPTWKGDSAAMQIDSVKVWSF